MGNPVIVKGNGNKLEFWLDSELSYAELRQALVNRLDVNASFYIGSKRPVVFYGKIFTDAQKRELKSLMVNEYCFNHVSFVDDEVDKNASMSHHESVTNTNKHEPEQHNENKVIANELLSDEVPLYNDASKDVFLCQTIRSGQRIQAEGNITIIGDANAGSEIIAGGNIAVFGRLSGMVHAGAYGDSSACITANKLKATQIRISGKIAVLPPRHKSDKPEMVKIIDGKIAITGIN